MRRLLGTLLLAAALLHGLDRLVAHVVTPTAERHAVDRERHEQFRHVIAQQFDALRADVGRLLAEQYARWDALPDRKRPRELRVVILGNSTAMFALAPTVVAERLATDFPERDVTVTPLFLPGAQVLDEEMLVRAAVAKHADVIVTTPNLSDLVPGRGSVSDWVGTRFRDDPDWWWYWRPTDALDVFLERHWLLYRERALLRTRIVHALEHPLPGPTATDESRRAISDTFAAVAEAGARGDAHGLVAAYHAHGMGWFLGGPIAGRRLPPASPVYDAVTTIATTAQRSGATGVAIFMPVHPLFRDANAMRDFPNLLLDDAYVHAVADRALGIYRAAGFATFDRVDALPASAFIDYVHVNATGMEMFSRETADMLAGAIRRAHPPAQ